MFIYRQGGSVDMKGIQVSTVDAFQGGERDIIILSTVRTDACGFIDNDKYGLYYSNLFLCSWNNEQSNIVHSNIEQWT